jgi:hypothetical protein
VADAQRQPWANTMEFGPGIKYRPHFFPRNVYFSTDFLGGARLIDAYNLSTGRKLSTYYNDIRVGFWYAITK